MFKIWAQLAVLFISKAFALSICTSQNNELVNDKYQSIAASIFLQLYFGNFVWVNSLIEQFSKTTQPIFMKLLGVI